MYVRILAIFLSLFLAVSCAPKKRLGTATSTHDTAIIADVREIPQNLETFASSYGKRKLLLSANAQQQLYESFQRIYFGPWQMSKTSIKRGDVAASFKKARGYKENGTPWSQEEWDAMRQNANLAAYPAMAMGAITIRNTDLRELPTSLMRLSKPVANVKDDPFDYFQYSLLPPGTPLLAAHKTMDGNWYYVECPIAGGWVRAADVRLVDDSFKSAWLTGNYAALIRDNVPLANGIGQSSGAKGGIGTVLPVTSRAPGYVNVLVPVAGSGEFAHTAEISLPPQQATIMPMPITAGNVAKIGNVMLGQSYGWGGMFGDRDCSSMLRDLFTPFGLWLPRNSVAQARRGSVIPLEGYDAKEKERIILADGVPFLSLLGMRGHITLYVGQWRGRPAIFHNVWGVRIIKDGDDNERHVIGKAVITSITPGIELENLYRPVTFVDRLRTLTRLGTR